MKGENLNPLTPDDVASMCRAHSVKSSVTDETAWLLLVAEAKLRSLSERLLRQSLHLERAEMEIERLGRLHYGPTKGGGA